MKCLFIVDKLYPLKNANTICVSNIIDGLAKHNEITILSYSRESSVRNIDNNIHSICFSYDYDRMKKINDEIWKIFHYPLRNRILAQLYKDNIQMLINKEQYDAVVFVVNPLEPLYTITKVFFPSDTKIIIYELDSISDTLIRPILLRPILYFKSLCLERICYEKAYAIIHMKCHQNHFKQWMYKKYYDKFVNSDFPVLVEKDCVNTNSSSYKSLLFAGTMLKQIRNPLSAFNILLEVVNQRNNTRIDFYSKGDFENSLELFCQKSNGSIVRNGFVDTLILDRAIRQADILISIGNTFSSFAPSKVYEYLSWKKPIIHFYHIDNDPVLETFGTLEFVLFIDMRENLNKNVSKILDFIDNIENVKVEIEGLFIMNRPEYTIRLLMNMMGDSNE